MAQDTFQQARERYDDAQEAWRENYDRMREDLRFSNPADPQQWPEKTLEARKNRDITLTLDQTNQFIQQVVNDGRQNTPSLSVTPGDDRANVDVALKQAERLRYFEYRSRAAIAYDTSLEYSARCALGWLRFVPVVVDRENNFQEPRIFAVNDPLSACIDGDSTEFDGSDAAFGFVETTMHERTFKRKYPKARVSSFGETKGWFSDKGVRVAEYFSIDIKRGNRIITGDDRGENRVAMTEDQYHEVSAKTGTKPRVIETDPQAELGREVKWRKMSGCEILEETDFPCTWIGLIPVYGHMVWVDGKRYVSGLTRRLMGGQRFYNVEMTSLAESLLEQPKAPFLASARAIKGHEDHWARLNKGNPSYLPFNDLPDDPNDPPIAAPQRMSPPTFPAAFANGAQLGIQAMMSSVGMNKSVLGQQSNAVSGRAKVADKIEGDSATFHYVDNQRRSIEHLGRCLLDMDSRLIDSRRTVRTLSLDGKSGTVTIDPDLPEAIVRNEAGKVEAINPRIGQYDTRVKVGPGYTTLREELKDRLTTLGQANPALAAALAPILVKLEDLPEADKITRICLALLPPQVQAAYSEGEDDEAPVVPPAVRAEMQAMQGKLEQAGQLLAQLAEQLQQAQGAAQQAAGDTQEAQMANALKARELDIKGAEADSKRIEAEADMLRAETEARAAQDQAAAASLSGQVQDIIAAVTQMAEVQAGAAQDVATVGAAVGEAKDQIAQLADLVTQPRVATIEYDEQGRPVRAVGEVATN